MPSPGVPPMMPALAAARAIGVPVWSEIELAWRFLRGRLICITGSNGKTTTTSLIGHILETARLAGAGRGKYRHAADFARGYFERRELYGGRGQQLSARIDFRVSSGHCACCSTSRRIIWTATDRSKPTAAPRRACLKIKRRKMPRSSTRTMPWLRNMRPLSRGYFGSAARNAWPAAAIFAAMKLFSGAMATRPFSCERKDIGLRGSHNIENVLAAAAAARLAGAEPAAIAEGVRTFAGVEHRIEYVATISGVEYFNDSKATNVDATLKALDAFPGNVLVILGGKDKGSDYRILRQALRSHARMALLDRQRGGKDRSGTCRRRPRGARRDAGARRGNRRAARAARRHRPAGAGLRELRSV